MSTPLFHLCMMMARKIILSTPTVEYLVVGGGGATENLGGFYNPPTGGGGGGGLKTAAGYAVSSGAPISVVVGRGGITATGSTAEGSIFGSISVVGGGKGAGNGFATVGGSGGGGALDLDSTNYKAPAAGTAGQGYAGGAPWSQGDDSYAAGGGGGGAGGVGGSAVGLVGGLSGPPFYSSITGTSLPYAGGGQGGSTYQGIGVQGLGPGGGAGGVNTGGAGGGTAGAVIIRYPDTYPLAASTTGSPTITNVGGYRIYQWTVVGTWSITF